MSLLYLFVLTLLIAPMMLQISRMTANEAVVYIDSVCQDIEPVSSRSRSRSSSKGG
jgi:hypothetical protein